MSYYREQETGDAIENFAKWAGDKPQIMQSIKFDQVKIDHRDRRMTDSVTRVGCDAQLAALTDDKLHRLSEKQRTALLFHHGERWIEKQKAAACECSVKTYRQRVSNAHVKFWGGKLTLHDHETRANA